jgi:hypothetical protein
MAIQVELIGDSVQVTLDNTSHGLFGGPCQQVLNRREILRLIGLLLAASDTLEAGAGERQRIFESVQKYWESSTATG